MDVISHESNSYFTDEREIHVPVGNGDKPLPQMLVYKRMREKTDGMISRVHVQDAQVARSQEDASKPAQREEAASSGSSAASDREIQELKVQKQTLEQELAVCRAREDQFKRHFYTHRHSAIARAVLDGMPAELADWVNEMGAGV